MKRVIVVSMGSAFLCGNAVAGEFYFGANMGKSGYEDTADAGALPDWDFDNLPSSAPITGRRFDSDDFSWSAFAGWAVTDWFAIEAGYVDLGEGVSEHAGALIEDRQGEIAANGTASTVTTSVSEFYIGPKFRWVISDQFSITALAAVSEANFDSSGNQVVARILNDFPNEFPVEYELASIPVESPDKEIGSMLGLGFQWTFNQKWSVDLSVRRHDTRVMDVDTVMLGFQFTP